MWISVIGYEKNLGSMLGDEVNIIQSMRKSTKLKCYEKYISSIYSQNTLISHAYLTTHGYYSYTVTTVKFMNGVTTM